MHLTLHPAAYSITALKSREGKIVKVLHSHASCRDQKLSFFILVHGGLFQYGTLPHCDASGCRIMPKWDNTLSWFGLPLKADIVAIITVINCVAL